MEPGKILWIIGLVGCTIYFTATLDESFAFDRPVHSSIAILIACGAALLLSQRIRQFHIPSASSKLDYAPIPLQDLRDGQSDSRPASPVLEEPVNTARQSTMGIRIRVALVVILLTARIEVLRRVVQGVECSTHSLEPMILLFIAVAEWWKYRSVRQQLHDDDDDDDIESTAYGEIVNSMVTVRWRAIVVAGLLCWASIATIKISSPAPSTYICPKTSPDYTTIPRLQTVGVLLDGLLGFVVFQLLDSMHRRHSKLSSNGVFSVGLSLLIAAALWILIGLFIYIRATPDLRDWISSYPRYYSGSTINLALVASFSMLCAVRSIHYLGVLSTSALVVFTITYISLFICGWDHGHPFPPLSGGRMLPLLGMTLGAIGHAIPGPQDSFRGRASLHWGVIPSLIILLGIQAIIAYNGDDEVNYHPIDLLMYYAKEHHATWWKQAGASMELVDATSNYTARYGRNPPPHFDEWYKYAVGHNSYIIDDFDNMYHDLLPFWSLSPAEIRQRTWEAIADPNNGVAGIIIRDGKASISGNVPETDRWMLDGVVQMIDKFGQWIPDMDLAFNLNNGSQVAVSFKEMEHITATAVATRKKQPGDVLDFSTDRATEWQPIPAKPVSSNRFQDFSSKLTWDEFGTIACSPASPARTQRLWDVSKLCHTCALPHSLGAYLSNWTLSGEVCHQPDLARLHGFYASPVSFAGTHDLMPIFSQSKAYGFNDILYPSATHYLDKVIYAPSAEYPDRPFEDKKPLLFWRGSSGEGTSAGNGEWRGMAAQRLAHLITNTSSSQALLLPHPVAHYIRKARYAYVSPEKLHESIPTDIQFDSLTHCSESDCHSETAELAPTTLAPRTDFQETWAYRYLLDIDDSGGSARFLPMVLSRSLPLRAGVFRQWYDGRLTPWLHFVPVDVRGQGLWATVAYFAGFSGVVGGQEVRWPGKRAEAERIAEAGRDWARQVLRKEDMEVYLFRVLLEWGRLTDERREELGFVVRPGGV